MEARSEQQEVPKAPASIPEPNSNNCLTQKIKKNLPPPSDKISVFIFRRDLRIFDNTSLIAAAADGFKILAVFIFPPEQIEEKENEYCSSLASVCSVHVSIIEPSARGIWKAVLEVAAT